LCTRIEFKAESEVCISVLLFLTWVETWGHLKFLYDGIFVYSKPDAAYLELRHC
jgi:hypothetical protein